ncbi:hypothetical protein DUNSADRAFT_16228 [Dunaliella salina]|uniref:Uncharacterized protein n=1 Tax=Dunaliella salina TaxID=3046 RepID=A0ABQ7H137_DUNSA|nr:hypothetical protein DUNSADRAFT_16228 [Dunaliella salina]|eukprot:KAF5840565.1 hypothetical protein DUNSADRAFT_16228 [Dunaliella salina]
MHALQMANPCCSGKVAQRCPRLLLPPSASDIRVRSICSSSYSAGVLAGSSVNQARPALPASSSHLQPPARIRVMAAPAAAEQQQDVASQCSDLLVYGPGVLGSYAGYLWKEKVPGARVLGLTNTSNNHDRLQKMGLETATKDSLTPGKKYAHVLFARARAGSEDYVAEVCVYAGGNVVRLVGLYHTHRGAHSYMLRAKEIQRPGDYVVNLLHYEDAARLTTSVSWHADGSGPFSTHIHADGKRCNNGSTRAALGGWTPKYSSFAEFMHSGGRDYYNTCGLF